MPASRAEGLGSTQREDCIWRHFVHVPWGRPCAWCTVLCGEGALDDRRFPSLLRIRISNLPQLGGIYYLQSRTFHYKIEVVSCERYDAVRITRKVLGFTGLRTRREVEGAIYQKDSHWHNVRSAVGTDGRQPSRMSIRSSRFRSLSKSLVQTLAHLLPRNQGRTIAIEILLRNRFFQRMSPLIIMFYPAHPEESIVLRKQG